jgi:hypothetical protein
VSRLAGAIRAARWWTSPAERDGRRGVSEAECGGGVERESRHVGRERELRGEESRHVGTEFPGILSAKLNEPRTAERKFEEVVKDAEQAAVLVLVY